MNAARIGEQRRVRANSPGRARGGRCSRGQQGYILLTLLLFVALLTIAAAAIVPTIEFQVKRDREEELIHRGVQYSRAVRRYVKKFGRYPTRIEDLLDTNQVRFLRKKYKDPITGADFKLLRMGDVQLMPGLNTVAGVNPLSSPPPGVNAAQLAQAGIAGAQQAMAMQQAGAGGVTSATGTGQADKFSNSASGNSASSSPQQGATGQGGLGGQVFGGGPIVGVVSTSKDKTIREFNNKNHYNQWQFIYDPSTDRGGLLNTPAQPPLQVAAPPVAGQPGTGQPGTAPAPGAGFGTPQPQSPAPPSTEQPEQ